MFKLTKKTPLVETKRLSPGSYVAKIYLQKKSGPGILNSDFYINGIKKDSTNIVCKNSICKEIPFNINAKSNIKIKISSKYAGINLVKKIDFVLTDEVDIVISKSVAMIVNHNLDLYSRYYDFIDKIDGFFNVSLLHIEPNQIEQRINNPNIKHFKCHHLLNLDNYILNNKYNMLIIDESKNIDDFFNKIGLNIPLISLSSGNYFSEFLSYNIMCNIGSYKVMLNKKIINISSLPEFINNISRETKLKLRRPYPGENIKRGCLV